MIIKDGKRIDGLGDSMPIGSIIEISGMEVPDGWEEVFEPEDATIHIGPTEPTDGQEVWMQTSDNLFNKDNYIFTNTHIGFDASNLKIGESYTFTTNVPITGFKISNDSYGHDSVLCSDVAGFTTFTFTMAKHKDIPDSAQQYVFFCFGTLWDFETGISRFNDIDIQIRTVKKIYTQNNDGDYEKFLEPDTVECGSNANGYWIKHSNGIMECFGTIAYVGGKFASWGANGWYSQIAINKKFPAPFIKRPKLTYSKISDDGGLGDWRKEEIMMVYLTSAEVSDIVLYSDTEVNLTATSYLDYHAIGRWK